MGNVFSNPSDNVYDAYGKAVAAGQLYNDTLRKNMAFNALSKAYGPEVGDIKLATDAQALHQSKVMDPLLADQQSLTNAGLQQTNVFNKANDPIKLRDNQTIADTNANTLDQTQRIQKAAEVHGALSSAIGGLGQSLDGVTDPNARGAAFDAQITQLAPLLGVSPDALKQELAPQRQAVVTSGADALPQIQQQLDATLQANMSPADRVKLQIAQQNLEIQKSKADEAATKAAAVKASGGLTPAQQIAQQKADAATKKAKSADGTNVANSFMYSTALNQSIDDAEAIIKSHPDSYGLAATNVGGVGMQSIGGTPANLLAAKLETVKSNEMLTALRNLKASGATLSRTTNFEAQNLQKAIASVEQSQSKDQLLQGLESIRHAMANAVTQVAAAYKEDYGEDPPPRVMAALTAAGGKPDLTAPLNTPAAPAAPAATTAAPAAGAPPAGYTGDPQLWQYLTPEEQKLWQTQ